MHHGLSSKSFTDVLRKILEDMSSYQHIHNWDEKLNTSPLKALARVVRKYLNTEPLDLNATADYSTVDEIFTVGGVNPRPLISQRVKDIDRHLFFHKLSSRSYDQSRFERLIVSQETV